MNPKDINKNDTPQLVFGTETLAAHFPASERAEGPADERADGSVEGDVRALREMLAACEPYLKDGETPAERIERERRDTDAVLTLLIREKRKSEDLAARLAAATPVVPPSQPVWTAAQIALARCAVLQRHGGADAVRLVQRTEFVKGIARAANGFGADVLHDGEIQVFADLLCASLAASPSPRTPEQPEQPSVHPVDAPAERPAAVDDGRDTRALAWVSVNDRLPEKDVEVLVWIAYPTWANAPYVAVETWTDHREDPTGMSGPTMITGCGWSDNEFEHITHWMPLPSPPVAAIDAAIAKEQA